MRDLNGLCDISLQRLRATAFQPESQGPVGPAISQLIPLRNPYPAQLHNRILRKWSQCGRRQQLNCRLDPSQFAGRPDFSEPAIPRRRCCRSSRDLPLLLRDLRFPCQLKELDRFAHGVCAALDLRLIVGLKRRQGYFQRRYRRRGLGVAEARRDFLDGRGGLPADPGLPIAPNGLDQGRNDVLRLRADRPQGLRGACADPPVLVPLQRHDQSRNDVLCRRADSLKSFDRSPADPQVVVPFERFDQGRYDVLDCRTDKPERLGGTSAHGGVQIPPERLNECGSGAGCDGVQRIVGSFGSQT